MGISVFSIEAELCHILRLVLRIPYCNYPSAAAERVVPDVLSCIFTEFGNAPPPNFWPAAWLLSNPALIPIALLLTAYSTAL